MKSSFLLIPLFTYGCLAHEFYKLSPANVFQKRTVCGQGATCREACGGGAIPCGTSGYHCYDPTLGESCCTADEHYCPSGEYCAPVVGYCCKNSETPSNCASRLSFTLPLTTATLYTSKPATAVSTPTVVSSKSALTSILSKPASTSSSPTSTTVAVYSTPSSNLSSTAVGVTNSSSKSSPSQAQASTTTKSTATNSITTNSATTKSTTTVAVPVATFTGAAIKDTAAVPMVLGAVCLLAAFQQ